MEAAGRTPTKSQLLFLLSAFRSVTRDPPDVWNQLPPRLIRDDVSADSWAEPSQGVFS